jgi:hypothetical protein
MDIMLHTASAIANKNALAAAAALSMRTYPKTPKPHSARDFRGRRIRTGYMTRKSQKPDWLGIGFDAMALAVESNMVDFPNV